MVSVLISIYTVFLSFSNGKRIFRGWGRILIRVSVAALRVPRREDVLQRYYENCASLLEILRNKIFELVISGHHPFKCYVREGFARKVSYRKTFQSREGHSLKCCHIILHSLFEPKMFILEGCNRNFINKPISNFSLFAVRYSMLKELNGLILTKEDTVVQSYFLVSFRFNDVLKILC